ncbi:MAG: acyltransferase [Prolixibacteraceae bacterium]|nr:acyltransferase [Prolixibacteraceae bacterium]
MSDMIEVIWKLDLIKFISLNYLSKNIKRKKGCYVIPYKGSKIELHKGSEIIINGNLVLCSGKIKGSKAETYCLLYENAKLIINGTCTVAYGTMLQGHKDATIEVGSAHINSNTNIIADKSIKIGQDCLISRNVLIFDSDFHPVYDANHERANPPAPVVIEDHVWIGAGATILRGVNIQKGAVIGASALVTAKVPEGAMISAIPGRAFGKIEWSSK